MRAGRLTQRVRVLKPVRSTDAIGGTAITWTLAAETWCSIWPSTGREGVVGAAVESAVSHEIRMRKKSVPGLTSAYRLEMVGRTFEIVGVYNVEERGDQWRLLAVEHQAR